jgi:hypothetical protein
VPYDPALTAIAAATNDALTEHLWHYDIAGDDPVAHVALALEHAAEAFAVRAELLGRLLPYVKTICARLESTLAGYATVTPHGADLDAARLARQLQQFDDQRESLLALYRVWRRHRPATRDPRIRHLLLQPFDPRYGMVTLGADDTGRSWYVVPDEQAALAFGLPGHGTLVGDIRLTDAGWAATAFTDPRHEPGQVFALPPADTEAAACQALLRWWEGAEARG